MVAAGALETGSDMPERLVVTVGEVLLDALESEVMLLEVLLIDGNPVELAAS